MTFTSDKRESRSKILPKSVEKICLIFIRSLLLKKVKVKINQISARVSGTSRISSRKNILKERSKQGDQ